MYRVIGSDGKVYGPVGIDVISRWAAENRLNAFTLVQKEGTTEWKPLYLYPELLSVLEAQVSPPYPDRTSQLRGAELKIIAGICGIFLGWSGLHKFILGYTRAGLIMLLSSILTCFLAGWIMWLIGFVEGVLYLTMSDDEFVHKYIQHRREWF